MTLVLVASALAMGIFGAAHCIVMCGGVVGVLCSGLPAEVRTRPAAGLRFVLGYNFGRVASYAAAGAAAGALGAVAQKIDALYGLQIGLRVFAASLMLGLGAYLAGAFHRFALLEKAGAPLWHRIEPLARRALPVSTVPRALAVGALWGFLPCGQVYAALALALAAGSAPGGALVMAAFGAATLPALLAMGTAAGVLARLARRVWVRRAAGIAIACFGLMNLATATAQAGLLHPATHECCAPRRG
jgi:sulfite exporter TauE/SafE